MNKEIPAYNPVTDKHYPSWSALLEAETNGYLVIIVATKKDTGEVAFANSTGGGMTKTQARNRAAKMRKNSDFQDRYNYKYFVRPDWKADTR